MLVVDRPRPKPVSLKKRDAIVVPKAERDLPHLQYQRPKHGGAAAEYPSLADRILLSEARVRSSNGPAMALSRRPDGGRFRGSGKFEWRRAVSPKGDHENQQHQLQAFRVDRSS